MGYSYLLQRRGCPCCSRLQKAIALNKTNDRWRNHLGVAYAKMGKVHQALAEFKKSEEEAASPASGAAQKPEAGQIAGQQAEEKNLPLSEL